MLAKKIVALPSHETTLDLFGPRPMEEWLTPNLLHTVILFIVCMSTSNNPSFSDPSSEGSVVGYPFLVFMVAKHGDPGSGPRQRKQAKNRDTWSVSQEEGQPYDLELELMSNDEKQIKLFEIVLSSNQNVTVR